MFATVSASKTHLGGGELPK